MGDIGEIAALRSPQPRVVLLFESGQRPSIEDAKKVLLSASGGAASIVVAPQFERGCIELVTAGLTFDLCGLTPGVAEGADEWAATYGFDDPPGASVQGMEGAVLLPGTHIAGGAMMLPVLRVMLGLAANLAMRLPVKAVGWSAASTLMEPRYFSLSVLNWLSGGPFPSQGLTALVHATDGSVTTRGLAHLIGYELHLEGRAGERAEEAKALAARTVDRLIRHGVPTEVRELADGNEGLTMEPSAAGKLIWVWRGR